MSKKEKWGFALYVIFMLAVTTVSIFYSLWVNLLWLWIASFLLYALWQQNKEMEKMAYTIKSQDVDLDYLMSLDPFKNAKQAKTEARVSASNCYRYLCRINELKSENEQLKMLNKNLIEHAYSGKHKGKRK